MPYVSIRVNDHGLRYRLEGVSSKSLVAAERKGITEAVKLGRQVARAGAPKRTGKGRRGITYRVRQRSGTVEGKVRNKVFYMRFQARGTGKRFTGKGAYRGKLTAVPFMTKAAHATDPAAPRLVDTYILAALRSAGLL